MLNTFTHFFVYFKNCTVFICVYKLEFVVLQTGGYAGLDDLYADLNLVFENAKRYNADESIIFKVNDIHRFSYRMLEPIFHSLKWCF
jgi:hypothetical protein